MSVGVFPILLFISRIGLAWLTFFLCVKALTLVFPKVLEFIDDNNINVSLYQASWKTVSLNHRIQRLSQRFHRFWVLFYKIGVGATLLSIPISFGLFLYNLSILLFPATPQTQAIISPIVPGVNVKSDDSVYLFLSILISMLVHELGHAICAYTNDVRINNVGFFLMLVIPGAHVTIDTENIYRASKSARLKIFSAGVWHNIVLAGVAWLLVFGQSAVLFPLYHYSSSELYIIGIPDNSLLSKSLAIGDRIVEINQMTINNLSDYIGAMQTEIDSPSSYCLQEATTIACLNNLISNNQSNFRSCFEYNSLLNLKKCSNLTNGNGAANQCDKGSRCIDFSKIGYRYFNLVVQSSNPKYRDGYEILPFVGEPVELWEAFTVDRYKARFGFLEGVDIPFHLNKLVQYIIGVSLGLAVFNAMPINALDGEYILETVLLYLFSTNMGQCSQHRHYSKTKSIILNITLVLLLLNVFISYFKLFF